MLEARVSTEEATEPTVCVDARASRRIVKSFSDGVGSSSSCAQFSCSYCCLFVLIQNLHTRYVMIPMTATPPITPPAIAPTLAPDPDDTGAVVTVVGADEAGAQIIF